MFLYQNLNSKDGKVKKRTVKDVGIVMDTIKNISNKEYQNHIWVEHRDSDIVDSYDDTTMYFCEEGEAALKARDAGRIEMTDNQYHMLKKLYDMVDAYDMNDKRPDHDKGIVNDPRWHEIRNYAKLVYEELIKE